MPLVLIERLTKGSKLTPAEMDGNLTAIENAINGFAAQIAVALNPDGTLKNGAVATGAIQDRAVTLDKLAFLSSFWAADTGVANALAISFTPALGAYSAGLVFFVKAVATNNAASTLKVDSNAPVAIKKYTSAGISDVVAGDLQAAGEYIFVHDGTYFILANPTPPAKQNSVFYLTPQIVKSFAAAATWATIDISAYVPPATVRFAILYCAGKAVEGGPAANACQFTGSFRSDSLGLVYQGQILEGGNVAGTSVSFTQSGLFWVPVKVAGSTVTYDTQLVQTVVGNTDSVAQTQTLIGYST